MLALRSQDRRSGEPSHQFESWSFVHVLVLLQPILKPRLVQYHCALLALGDLALECMLEADFAPVLLAKERADDGIGAATEGVAGYEVGDCEEDEGVEVSPEAGV